VSCAVHHNLTGTLTPRCLSKNAKHRGTIVLGGVLECDNWVETFENNGNKVMADILMDKDINVPIRAVFRSVKGFYVEEYWNFKETVGHDVFVIPSVCKQTDEIIYE